MNILKYKITTEKKFLEYKRKDNSIGTVDINYFKDGIDQFNEYLKIFTDLELPLGEVLGLRNLSAFIGELFNIAVCKKSKNTIKKNPHQDGYPDLLVMDTQGKKIWELLKNRLHEKQPFSYFETGGIEVKATCGDLRSGSWFTKKNIKKPGLGNSRLEYVTGYNWKSHHRFTNNLLGLIWDFIDGVPTITAMMYSDRLVENDWGKTVRPVDGGGRTTSVSIMNKNGINKMFNGLILVIESDNYSKKMLERLSKY